MEKDIFGYELYPLGDCAVTVKLGRRIDHNIQQKVSLLARSLEEFPFPGFIEVVPAFTTITVHYDPMKVIATHLARTEAAGETPEADFPYNIVCDQLEKLFSKAVKMEHFKSRTIVIPVCYGGDYGQDLEFVAQHNGLSPRDVISIHSQGEYIVYMIGFAPGFPYLGGMSEHIAAPRRKSPRLAIPTGTVGIAGKQTGIYSVETPGGWQLIGRTPLSLFRPHQHPPSLLQAGDKIRFQAISEAEFEAWKETDFP